VKPYVEGGNGVIAPHVFSLGSELTFMSRGFILKEGSHGVLRIERKGHRLCVLANSMLYTKFRRSSEEVNRRLEKIT
jgi:hypothetical protein